MAARGGACRVPHDSLAELLHDDRAEIRALAARATAEMPQPVRVETIERFVFDPDSEVRAQMARALGRSADVRAAPLLAALARDTEWFVRLRAQAAMGQLNRRECLDAILYGTRDPNFQVRARAAEALSRMALDPADVLAMMLKAGDRYALEAYVTLLGRSGHLWRTLSLLRARDPIVRAKAEELIGAVVSAGVTQEFVYALEVHPDRRVRARLARLLARHADAGALFAPIDRLRKRASDRRQLQVLNWLARESTHALADRV